jgi:HK97 family phage portal protein
MGLKNWLGKTLLGATGYKDSSRILEMMTGHSSFAGVSVNAQSAMKVPVVSGGLNVIAESVAMLPLVTYRRVDDRNKVVARDLSVYGVLHDLPNERLTSYDWRRAMITNMLLRGNAYSWVQRSRIDNEVIKIEFLKPWFMNVDTKGGEITYFYDEPGVLKRDLHHSEIIHLKHFQDDTLYGKGLLDLGKNAIGFLIAAEKFGSDFFANGAMPSILLIYPGELDEEQENIMRRSFIKKYIEQERGSPILLKNGMQIETLTVDNTKSQFLELRRFQIEEIARLLRLTPHKLQDLSHATFSNVESLGIQFVTDTLLPALIHFEQQLFKVCLTEEQRKEVFFEFKLDSLLRGQTLDRYRAYATGIQNGFLNPNEVRGFENMNEREGGDEFILPANMDLVSGRLQELEERLNQLQNGA